MFLEQDKHFIHCDRWQNKLLSFLMANQERSCFVHILNSEVSFPGKVNYKVPNVVRPIGWNSLHKKLNWYHRMQLITLRCRFYHCAALPLTRQVSSIEEEIKRHPAWRIMWVTREPQIYQKFYKTFEFSFAPLAKRKTNTRVTIDKLWENKCLTPRRH